MLTQRAWSLLEVKSLDAEKRILTGIASTPTPDRQGDVMVPEGAKFTLPMPLLWQHRDPIGEVFEAKVTSKGIQIKARIAQVEEAGLLKERLDLAWQSIREKLVKGFSIGWRPLKETYDKITGNFIYPEWEWYETSAVTIPANAEATIQNIKSIDVGLALSGEEAAVDRQSAGVPASSRVVKTIRTEHAMKKSYADQIATWEATRAAKAARQDEIQAKASDESRSKDEAEKEEFKNLDLEIKGIDEELVDLRLMDAREKANAKPARGENTEEGSRSRGQQIIVSEKTLPPGIGFARMAMCFAMGRGSLSDSLALAKMHYPDDSRLEKALRVKAAIGAGAVVTSHWADDLVPYNILQGDFINFLRAGNIVDKFGGPNPGGGPNYPTLRRVPFNVRVSGFSSGTSGNWVGEGLPIPMSKAVSFNATLTWAKVGGLVALTKEEIRFSNPSAEAKVRDDIAAAINTRIDIDFVDPAKAAVANVSPASITDSIVATAPAGATAANLISDLAKVMALFAAANLSTSDVVIIMSGSMASQISMMTTTLGFPFFPSLSPFGGTLRGIPVLVSENMTAVGSPSTQTIVFAKASEIYLADDGNVTIDVSDQASLEMLDSSLIQTGVAGTGASLVSLWQNGLVGIMAQREITWKLRRSTAVRYISPAAYAA